MAMTKEELEQAKKEIQGLIESGANVVDLNIFDTIENYKIPENIKNIIDYFYEAYEEYHKIIMSENDENRTLFLKTLKEYDIKVSNEMEKEDSFMITLYREIYKECSIDMLIERINKKLTKQELIEIHDKLLSGTSTEHKIGLRTDNLKYVGTNYNNIRTVDYFPILSEKIDVAIDKFLELYNNNLSEKPNKYDIILRPIMYHGLIAALQMFNDGNTRFGRNIQHVELWRMLNENLYKSELPLLYASKQYMGYRTNYRQCIRNIAVLNNAEAWTEWFRFNINRFEDTIYKNKQYLERYNKIKNRF